MAQLQDQYVRVMTSIDVTMGAFGHGSSGSIGSDGAVNK